MNPQEQERINRMREAVNKALTDYRDDINNTGAGYTILRYARMGYLKECMK